MWKKYLLLLTIMGCNAQSLPGTQSSTQAPSNPKSQAAPSPQASAPVQANALPLFPIQQADTTLSFTGTSSLFVMALKDMGQGVIVSLPQQAPDPIQVVGLQELQTVVEQPESVPLAGDFATLSSTQVLLDDSGDGQVLMTEMKSFHNNPFGVGMDSGVWLSVHVLPLSQFKPQNLLEPLNLPFAVHSLGTPQVLVDSEGNGILSVLALVPEGAATSSKQNYPTLGDDYGPLQTSFHAQQNLVPKQFQLLSLPIQKYRIEHTWNTLDLPLSGNTAALSQVWLDSEQNGLVFSEVSNHWNFVRLEQGRIATTRSFAAQTPPQVKLDAEGNGFVFLQTAAEAFFVPVNHFQLESPQTLALSVSEDLTLTADFQGKEGVVVATPFHLPDAETWPIQVHHLEDGKLKSSQSLQFPLQAQRIPLGVQVTVLANGQGVLGWGSIQQGGFDPRFHLHFITNTKPKD